MTTDARQTTQARDLARYPSDVRRRMFAKKTPPLMEIVDPSLFSFRSYFLHEEPNKLICFISKSQWQEHGVRLPSLNDTNQLVLIPTSYLWMDNASFLTRSPRQTFTMTDIQIMDAHDKDGYRLAVVTIQPL
jgi:hypothetical protein